MKISDFKNPIGINLIQKELQEINKKTNLLINECLIPGAKSGPLVNVPYVCKDNISTSGVVTTGGSALLRNYIPPFGATVVTKLKEAGAICIGKSNLDELAVGGTGINPFFGATLNPLDTNRKAGGSSSGSAAAVAAGVVPFSLGTDTGDSIRKPASYTGIVGAKLSFGRVSRYGVFPFACSLDHVGVFATDVYDTALVSSIISGHDVNDITSLDAPVEQYHLNLNSNISGKKIVVIQEIYSSLKDKEMKAAFNKVLDLLRHAGAEVTIVDFGYDLLKAILPTYLIISSAEATSNNANLTSIAFGTKEPGNNVTEEIINSRSAGFGKLIKRRFMLGSHVLSAHNQERYFVKAQKVRRLISDRFNKLLDGTIVIAPAAPSIATMINAVKEQLEEDYVINDNYMALANFTGTPSMTIPIGVSSRMPFGININTAFLKEQEMFDVAYFIEQALGGEK